MVEGSSRLLRMKVLMDEREYIGHLVDRCYLLCDVLMENCKYRMIGVEPSVCTFFNDGPRYRQECTMRACPVLEKERE